MKLGDSIKTFQENLLNHEDTPPCPQSGQNQRGSTTLSSGFVDEWHTQGTKKTRLK
jgi:hypothetical protein